MSETVGMKDTLAINITGLSEGGSGRQTQMVNEHFNLNAFLNEYGEAEAPTAVPDWESLKELGKTNPAKFQAEFAKLGAQLAGAGAKSLPQRIVDAICKYLEKERGFVIADQDPGVSQYYVSRGNLRPTALDIPGDGKSWYVVAAAPFG